MPFIKNLGKIAAKRRKNLRAIKAQSAVFAGAAPPHGDMLGVGKGVFGQLDDQLFFGSQPCEDCLPEIAALPTGVFDLNLRNGFSRKQRNDLL